MGSGERERENKTLQQTLSLLHGSYCHSLIRMSEAKAKCLGRVSCWDSNLHNMSNSIIEFHKVMVQPTEWWFCIYIPVMYVWENTYSHSQTHNWVNRRGSFLLKNTNKTKKPAWIRLEYRVHSSSNAKDFDILISGSWVHSALFFHNLLQPESDKRWTVDETFWLVVRWLIRASP